MPKHSLRIAVLLLCGGIGSSVGPMPAQRFAVLDGDTVIVDGSPIKLAGIDTPELGPWARCWAEAALAGHAREYLHNTLLDARGGDWSITNVSMSNEGRRTANVVRSDGFDISENMVVRGFAARTDSKWDWCGGNANLHSVDQDEPPPYGPNLWWPTAHMFDARAAD